MSSYLSGLIDPGDLKPSSLRANGFLQESMLERLHRRKNELLKALD